MTSAANHEAYGDPRWSSGRATYRGPWAGHGWGWGHGPYWHPFFAAKPVLIAGMILGFIFWWPIGLVLLVAMLATGRFACGRHGRNAGGWSYGDAPWTGWKSWGGGMRSPPSSGNRAFDEYRAETLKRLEDEQKEFGEFLDRLRFAKDKSEFDQFMNERRNRPPEAPPEQPQGSPA